MFSSFVPVYYDQRWHLLQLQDHLQGYCGNQNHQLQPPLPPLSQVGGGGAPVKANSMADKARLAKLPQPEAGLKCPRCESTDTKFCYFNNYNLSQPRHFCKTCRRYWTRGGAVRNIPVGGGCRKNKRSKSKSSSKSHHQVIITSSATASASTPSGCSTETTNYFPTLSPHLQTHFMDDIQTCGGGHLGVAGFQPKIEAGDGSGDGGEACLGWFQSGSSNCLSVGGAEQWRLPLLTGLEAPVNFFQYQSHESVDQARSGASTSQLAPMEMEESQLRLNLSGQFMGVCENNDQFCGGIQWREISGVNSSSPSNLL